MPLPPRRRAARLWAARAATCLLCLPALPVGAQQLIYTPVNPSFGGSPLNSAHLMAVANAQNTFHETSAASDPDAALAQQIKSRLLTAMSSRISDAIFGPDAQDHGSFSLGDQTISFVRGLDTVDVTITDADGHVTEIQVPLLVSAP